MKQKEEWKVYAGVFDESTLKALYELSKKYFKALIGPISTGKEADVYKAEINGKFIALKIYRINTSNFNCMTDYIIGDPRFDFVKKSKRQIVFAWTKKEFKNLELLRSLGIKAPKPLGFKDNVLAMEYIGTQEKAAPLAKNRPPKNPKKWYKLITKWIIDMYEKKGFVHADLNEFNILNHREMPVIIDVGQGVLKQHPKAHEFLARDIEMTTKWFSKIGIKDHDKINKWLANILSKEEK